MNDQERLANLKKQLWNGYNRVERPLGVYIKIDELDWLIRQAEQLQAEQLKPLVIPKEVISEEDIEKLRAEPGVVFSPEPEVKSLREENKKLKEVLKFYADRKTYNLSVQFSMGTAHPKHEPIKFDNGEKARKVLELGDEPND